MGEDVEGAIRAARSGGVSLPAPARSSMEDAFGAGFSSVRLHAGSGAAQLNRALSAEAFTVGSDIFFSHGNQPRTGRAPGGSPPPAAPRRPGRPPTGWRSRAAA